MSITINFSYEGEGNAPIAIRDIVASFDDVEVDGGAGITDDDIMEMVFSDLEGRGVVVDASTEVANRAELIAAVREGFRSAAEVAAIEADEAGDLEEES